MWETLDSEVMNKALGIHHAVIRRLVRTYRGYEQATEGDSFILSVSVKCMQAFTMPSTAEFILQLFVGSLSLPDPPPPLSLPDPPPCPPLPSHSSTPRATLSHSPSSCSAL